MNEILDWLNEEQEAVQILREIESGEVKQRDLKYRDSIEISGFYLRLNRLENRELITRENTKVSITEKGLDVLDKLS